MADFNEWITHAEPGHVWATITEHYPAPDLQQFFDYCSQFAKGNTSEEIIRTSFVFGFAACNFAHRRR